MKSFREIYIGIKSLTDENIKKLFKDFCKSDKNFVFKEKDSLEYSRNIGCDGFVIESIQTLETEPAKIAITQKNERTLYIANIVPKEKNKLSIDEYNNIAFKFFNSFKKFIRKSKFNIRVNITKDNIGLEQIITGKITLKFFKRYINAYPLSYHLLDIERLDFFICALSRYRTKLNLGNLKYYLLDVLGWEEEVASWCIRRIETGLDILNVNRKFYYLSN